MEHNEPSSIWKNGWTSFKYNSLCCKVLIDSLYFLFILNLPNCLLRLSLGNQTCDGILSYATYGKAFD